MPHKSSFILLGLLLIECAPLFSQTLKEAAESGDKVAQFQYANKLEEMYPKEKDYQEAVSWLIKSANQGYAPAQCNLGYHYGQGLGVKQDFEQEVFWYNKAAKQGEKTAQYNLGVCYSNGEGVTQSHSKAFFWYKQAADQGLAVAEYSVGKAYYYGRGVPVNSPSAVEWFQKAAGHKFSGAMYYLGECYSQGYGVTKNMTKAVEWYEKGADDYETNSQYALALLYLKGDGVEKDSIFAANLLLHSAGGGLCGPHQLFSYEKKDANESAQKKILELSSLNNSPKQYYFLAIAGCLYEAMMDFPKAEEYYKRAIELGGYLGTIKLGLMYFYIAANTPQLNAYYDYDWDGDEGPQLGLESYMFEDNSACLEYAKKKKWTDDDNVTYWLEKAIEFGVGSFSYGMMGYTVYDHLLFAYVDSIGSPRNIARAIDVSSLYLSDTTVSDGARYNVPMVYMLALEKPELHSKVFSSCKRLHQDFKDAHNEKYNEGTDYTAAVLGKCYYKGIGTQKDYNLAFNYLLEAVGGQDCESMRLLAACYRYGRGTKANKMKENEWVEKAARCGDEKAKRINVTRAE